MNIIWSIGIAYLATEQNNIFEVFGDRIASRTRRLNIIDQETMKVNDRDIIIISVIVKNNKCYREKL